ncbi:MAG: hypothetical protein HY317_06370 [Acidobacteria bacterium]|nr:hypothetical protein [Acidobacteriota bacterium]
MTAPEILSALAPVVEALQALGVGYYVGGSVASSAHGAARATLDVDLVADLQENHVHPLAERLAAGYYLDEGRMSDAVVRRRSFNLIHLETMLKVDVFVSKQRPFDREALARARPETLGEGPSARAVRIASAEDTLLAKLEWYRAGGEASERQWSDVIGVLRAVGGTLDVPYLRRWAASLAVHDLLDRALVQAGLASP